MTAHAGRAAIAALCLSGCLSAPPGASDAGAPAPDAAPEACGPVLFADDFTGTELGPTWDPSKSNVVETISLTGGRMVFDLTGTEKTGYMFTAVFSEAKFDAAETELIADTSVEITTQGDAFVGWWDAATDVYIGIRLFDYGDGFRIGVARGELGEGVDQLCPDPDCQLYDENDDRYLRLRGAGDQLVFESSPDRVEWKAVGASEPLPSYQPAILTWAECDIGQTIVLSTERIVVHDCATSP